MKNRKMSIYLNDIITNSKDTREYQYLKDKKRSDIDSYQHERKTNKVYRYTRTAKTKFTANITNTLGQS